MILNRVTFASKNIYSNRFHESYYIHSQHICESVENLYNHFRTTLCCILQSNLIAKKYYICMTRCILLLLLWTVIRIISLRKPTPDHSCLGRYYKKKTQNHTNTAKVKRIKDPHNAHSHTHTHTPIYVHILVVYTLLYGSEAHMMLRTRAIPNYSQMRVAGGNNIYSNTAIAISKHH